MCGHVGVAGDTNYRNKKIFEEMLTADQIRGPHSTGVASAFRHNKDVGMAKAVGPTFYLQGQKQYEKMMSQSSKCLIGHNRYATQGKITAWNAHPFEFKNLVGAHNGTIDWSSIKNLHKNELYDTDSEAVFSHISEHGVQAAVDQMEGAWALVWFNKENGSINFLRNDQRELYFGLSEDETTMYWASEAGLLYWVIGRNNVKLKEGKLWSVPIGIHMEFIVPSNITDKFAEPTRITISKKAKIQVYDRRAWAGNNLAWDMYDQTEYGGYVFNPAKAAKMRAEQATSDTAEKGNKSVVGSTGQSVIPFQTARDNHRQRHQQQTMKQGSGVGSSDSHQVIDTAKWRPPYKDFDGRTMKKPEVEERTNIGCVMCGVPGIKWGQFAQFLRPDVDTKQHFLCTECYDDAEVREMCKGILP